MIIIFYYCFASLPKAIYTYKYNILYIGASLRFAPDLRAVIMVKSYISKPNFDFTEVVDESLGVVNIQQPKKKKRKREYLKSKENHEEVLDFKKKYERGNALYICICICTYSGEAIGEPDSVQNNPGTIIHTYGF